MNIQTVINALQPAHAELLLKEMHEGSNMYAIVHSALTEYALRKIGEQEQ